MSKAGQNLIQIRPVNDTKGNTNPTNPIEVLEGMFDDFLRNITSAIGRGVDDIQGQLVGELTKSVGLKDVYRFYLATICEGELNNPGNANSGFKMTSCYGYEDDQKGAASPPCQHPFFLLVL
jgi:hypothetical protein